MVTTTTQVPQKGQVIESDEVPRIVHPPRVCPLDTPAEDQDDEVNQTDPIDQQGTGVGNRQSDKQR